MKVKSIEVQVQVEDSTLEEYDVRSVEADNSSTCYVISEAGKQFQLYVRNYDKETMFSCWLHMDGTLLDRHLLYANRSSTILGLDVNEQFVRPFQFSPLKLTDDDRVLNGLSDKQNLEQMGTIRCDLYRVLNVQPSASQFTSKIPAAINDDLIVHEKTKKAGAHRIQLGQEVIKNGSSRVNVTYIDTKDGPPYLTLTFRYRPKEMLQAQGIIPATQKHDSRKRPGPDEAGPSKRPRTTNDVGEPEGEDPKSEEAEEAFEALLAERAALEARIKAAEARRVKREPSPIVLGAANGEVIDLTDD